MQEMLFQTKALCYQGFLEYQDIGIPENKVTFLTGESGSGKSTLLKLFNRSISPSSGSLLYRGRPIEAYDSIPLRREVSLVSQSAYLFDGTILENFETVYRLRECFLPDEAYLEKILRICMLQFPLDQPTANLSGGEKQRLYIALFLSFAPPVLLLDEPTSALDQANAHGMMENLIGFCREKKMTPIIVSHDRTLVETYQECIVELQRRNAV
ncbi:ABC transporter ATP-binding protein [Candidatus Soleaferrea massiliensis]|uniref:ABC transporter ATP-binding protein n=1 Tax=Candidatus Soleaferrea massiliensis TaxID=1470354 RepID=UPI00058B2272|nr:ABC transporter ATP-binding protein [Candidatus Soleaferrea massiliensis]